MKATKMVMAAFAAMVVTGIAGIASAQQQTQGGSTMGQSGGRPRLEDGIRRAQDDSWMSAAAIRRSA